MDTAREAETVSVADLVMALSEGQSGALWRLRDPARQMDANLVRHLPGTGGEASTEDEVDVMLVVVAGDGTLTLNDETTRLLPGRLALLPRGASRSLLAGPEGLVVLTTHRRRSGMTIGHPVPAAPPLSCAVHLVCERCHRHAIEADARYCSGCGTGLPQRRHGK
ncbi:hypothetical protein [Streptomyces sp. NPDC001568]|uniref:hypothetical protein n=1 Tax=Streptomyces sp. NPDC001568 TaxID=3364588 RepID=UPI00368731D4